MTPHASPNDCTSKHFHMCARLMFDFYLRGKLLLKKHLFLVTSTSPMYLWSMFPAEDMWNWLIKTIRNRNTPEACMMFGWQDRQCMDLKHLIHTSPAPFKDPTKFMNDPDCMTYEMKGKTTTRLSNDTLYALVRYYVTCNAIVKGLWYAAITHFVSTHTAGEVRAAGIKQPTRAGALGGFEFKTQSMLFEFYRDNFRGEQ